MTKGSGCWEVKETPYVQEVYGQTDGEDNVYEQTYTPAQDKVAYIKGSVPITVFCFRVYVRFWFRDICTKYCPVGHTQVVPLRNIDRLCQRGVISCK